MSKVTSKLQVTIPKTVAAAHGIEPGSEIVFESAGDIIRVHRVREDPVNYENQKKETEFRLRLFDEATQRQKLRRDSQSELLAEVKDRGWKREDLYHRGDGGTA